MNRTGLHLAAAFGVLVSIPMVAGTGRAGAGEEADDAAARAESLAWVADDRPDAPPGDEPPHGGKGKCAAWELDGSLLALESCPAKGASHDYVECGKRVRDKAKELLCAKLGKGSHKYVYRVSDNKPSQNTAFCK